MKLTGPCPAHFVPNRISTLALGASLGLFLGPRRAFSATSVIGTITTGCCPAGTAANPVTNKLLSSYQFFGDRL